MARERAQLILIAGIGIAVTFVALALVLNTVIYTQNLATRSTVDGETAITSANAALTGVGGLISEANDHDYDSYLGLRRQFSRDVSGFRDNASLQAATSGTLFNVSLRGTRKGTHVVQETDRQFTSAGNSGTWVMATGMHHVRAFRLNVSIASLTSTPLTITVTSYDSGGSQVDHWTGELSDTGSQLKLANATDPAGCTRSNAGSRVSVDITGGTFNGSACDAIDLPTMTNAKTLQIEISNGGDAKGKYTFVVDQSRSNFEKNLTAYPYSGTVHDSPYAVKAIYDASVQVSYRRQNLNYTATKTVAPERKPGGERYSVETHQRGLVYVDGGQLRSIATNGTVTHYVTSGTVSAVGPMAVDFDRDGRLEIPYVNSTGALNLVDSADQTTTLATGVKQAPVAVGAWRGGPAVFYANATGELDRVSLGGTPTPVLNTTNGNPIGASGALGVADANGDGDTDLVFVESSTEVAYIDDGGTTTLGTVATGPGAGAPRVFDEQERVPVVESSNAGTMGPGGTTWTSSGTAASAPTAGIDWNRDGNTDLVYVDRSSGELMVVTSPGGTPQTITANGNPVTADAGVGVA